MPCPLCKTEDVLEFCEDKNRPYLQCSHCKLVFVPPSHLPTVEEEKQEYDKHENSPEDMGYRRFLSRIFDPISQIIAPNSKGLDFGCGPGPTLSVMFEETGHTMSVYDPIYFPNKEVLKEKYDFITSTEVVEHLHKPAKTFELLFSMLKPNAPLGLMTKMVIDLDAFKSWHYKNDPTHVCFFSRDTFEYIAEKYHKKASFIGKDVIIFQ